MLGSGGGSGGGGNGASHFAPIFLANDLFNVWLLSLFLSLAAVSSLEGISSVSIRGIKKVVASKASE